MEIKPIIDSSQAAWKVSQGIAKRKQEEFHLLLIDAKCQLMARRKIFKGTLNYTVCHPRDIFREAIQANAFGIIIIHNHPSGDVTPSKEDRRIANNLIQTGKVVGIPVIDFLIVGKHLYWSLGEEDDTKNQETVPSGSNVPYCQTEPGTESQPVHLF